MNELFSICSEQWYVTVVGTYCNQNVPGEYTQRERVDNKAGGREWV